jgi:hypothetical protein
MLTCPPAAPTAAAPAKPDDVEAADATPSGMRLRVSSPRIADAGICAVLATKTPVCAAVEPATNGPGPSAREARASAIVDTLASAWRSSCKHEAVAKQHHAMFAKRLFKGHITYKI